MRRCIAFVASPLLVVCASCSSYDPLYDAGTPRRLKDGSIVMTTRWDLGADSPPDRREIYARGGRITAFYDGRQGRLEGEVTEEAWCKLWTSLEDVAPWKPSKIGVEPDDPSGGPYHVVTLELDGERRAFSAQMGRGVLVFSTAVGRDRLQYSNLVVDFVAERATKRTREGPPPEWKTAASKPASKPSDQKK